MSGLQDSFVSVYSDARAEYTRQLCIFLTPSYFRWFIHLLDKARESTINEPRKLLWQFQTYLNDIPEWNMEKLNTEIHGIQTNIGCDYLEDLLTAVFIAHTKVLTAIRLTSKQKKIQITVPKVEHFLFKVLCESAKLLWGSSYLFNENVTNIEKQKNYRQIEGLIVDGIHQAIRALVPVKSILKDFVNQEEAEEEAEADGEAEAETEGDHEAEVAHETEKSVLPEIHSDDIIPPLNEESKAIELSAPVLDEGVNKEEIPVTQEVENTNVAMSQNDTQIIAPQIQESSGDNTAVQTNPVINISETPKGVAFTNYVTVFSQNSDNSEIIRDDAASDDGTNSLSLDFLDDSPQKLDLDDVENLDNEDENLPMNSNDYEELV